MPGSRTLILMRHATAGHQGASTDHDRPLTPEGVREAADAGDWIRHNLPPVDAVLCSTAVRTRQTVTATRIDAPATFADELYGGGIDDILEQIAQLPDAAGTVLVVGHAPGIPATAAELVTIAALARAEQPGDRSRRSRGGDRRRSGNRWAAALLGRCAGGADRRGVLG